MAAKRKKKASKKPTGKGGAPKKRKVVKRRRAPAAPATAAAPPPPPRAGAPAAVAPVAAPPAFVPPPAVPVAAPAAVAAVTQAVAATPPVAAGGMPENTHKAGVGTSAVIITAAQKAQGVNPATVATAHAAQPPNVVVKGGVSVQHLPGPGAPTAPVVTQAPTAGAVPAAAAVPAAPGVAPAAAATNATAPVGGTLAEAPDLSAAAAAAVGPAQPAPATADPYLRGMDAVSYAASQGWTGVHTTQGVVSLVEAATLAEADRMSVWAEPSTGPAPEQSPPGGAEGAEGGEDELGLLLEDDNREAMAYARHAGHPLSIEIRGTATVVSPSRLSVTHQEDADGATFIHIEPAEDDGSDPAAPATPPPA